MKNERELDRVLRASLDIGYKIPDIAKGSMQDKRPFDIFGVFDHKPWYIEGKFLKEPSAFNFSHFEDHQDDWLMKFHKELPDAVCVLLIGVVFGRGDIRVFALDIEEAHQRKAEGRSIYKKEFETRPYVRLMKGKVDYHGVLELLGKE